MCSRAHAIAPATHITAPGKHTTSTQIHTLLFFPAVSSTPTLRRFILFRATVASPAHISICMSVSRLSFRAT